MERNEILASALGLYRPWQILNVDFSPEADKMEIQVAFPAQETYVCPECGCEFFSVPLVHETWIHEKFLNYSTRLNALAPSVSCDCGHASSYRPWAGPGSRFDLIEA